MLSGHCGACSALASLADTNFVGNNLSGPFIVDFVCLEARLVVEIDGGQHNEEEGKAYDESRSQWLQQDGFRVLRFWNHEVLTQLESVSEAISNALSAR